MTLIENVCVVGIGFCVYQVLTSQSYKTVLASLIGIGVAIVMLASQ